MRHLNRGRKLSRTSSHRKALYRNLVASLFRHGRIITTPAKAKEARSLAERLITIAKNGQDSLAARRRAIQLLHDPALVRSLFQDLALRYKERPGGYTRILHLSRTRVGDGAPQAIFELVEGGSPAKPSTEYSKAVVADAPAAESAIESAPAAGSDVSASPVSGDGNSGVSAGEGVGSGVIAESAAEGNAGKRD